jgi:hypothetical protein
MIPKMNHPAIIPTIQSAFHFDAKEAAGRLATSIIAQITSASDAKLMKTNSPWPIFPLSGEVRPVRTSETYFALAASFAAEPLSSIRSR